MPQKWQIKCRRYTEIGKNAKKLKKMLKNTQKLGKKCPKMANPMPMLHKIWQKCSKIEKKCSKMANQTPTLHKNRQKCSKILKNCGKNAQKWQINADITSKLAKIPKKWQINCRCYIEIGENTPKKLAKMLKNWGGGGNAPKWQIKHRRYI